MNYSVGSSPRSVSVADFNHDGKPDLVANDDDAEWTIIVRPQTTGVYTNTATVTANEVDPNLSNNTDGSQTAVVTGISSVQLIPSCVKGGGNCEWHCNSLGARAERRCGGGTFQQQYKCC